MASSKAGFEQWVEMRRARVDATLARLFSSVWPDRLAEACLYPLQTGGKRIRPLWVMGTVAALGGDPDADGAVAAAIAVELVHTYSLVHDDLPCMDDDDERRGRPTAHVIYGVAPALLVGDALLTEAFAVLASAQLPADRALALVAELAHGAGARGMVGGQGGDIGMAGPVADAETLMRVHVGKTGALIRASVRMGAIVGGATEAQLQDLTRYGEAIGLAFQMADDVLDADQDAGGHGPPSYVQLLGLQETRARAAALLNEALSSLDGLPAPEMLAALARYTVDRDH